MKYLTCMFDTICNKNINCISFYNTNIADRKIEYIYCYRIVANKNYYFHAICNYSEKQNISFHKQFYINNKLYIGILSAIVYLKYSENLLSCNILFSNNTSIQITQI